MNTTTTVSEIERHEREFRSLLRHLLELKGPEGHPLICGDLMLTEILEDCEGRYGWSGKAYTPSQIIAFTYGESRPSFYSSDMGVVYGQLSLRYRHLVCGMGKPDWLCGPSGPQLLHPDFPVYVTDHEKGMEYIFSIKPMAPAARTPMKIAPPNLN